LKRSDSLRPDDDDPSHTHEGEPDEEREPDDVGLCAIRRRAYDHAGRPVYENPVGGPRMR